MNKINDMKKTSFPNFEFNLRTKTKFGVGEALNLGNYLKELSFKKIGLILDPAISNLKYTKDILENIKKEEFEKVKVWVYNLKGEPDYDSLDKIKSLFLNKNSSPLVDCFVGIGGGSVIDFAKGLSTLLVNPGKAINYRGFPTNINPCLATIAIPSTAGTGSEATFNAVFIDLNGKKKLGINTKYNFPALAILDPKLTLSCPKKVVVSSGIDTLVHCLEGYVAKNSTIFCRMFAKEGFKFMFNNLSKALQEPENIEIRMNLQLGAYLGGLALLGSGGGPTGALSYALGVHFKVPHGLAGGVFLPYIVEHNVKGGYDYGELCDVILGVSKSLDKRKKNQLFSKKLFQLWEKIGAPLSLKDFGVGRENVEIIFKEVENYEKAFEQNPTPFLVEDGKKLLLKLIK